MRRDLDQTEPTVRIMNEFVGSRVLVRQEVIRLDDGTESIRDVIYHPNSVVIVPIDQDKNVVMVRQFRKAAGMKLLELPAGVVEGDFSLIDAARRELREETGQNAERLVLLGDFFAAPGTLTERLYAFYADALYDDPLPADDDERINIEKFPLQIVKDMILSGEIIDGKTIAALFLAQKLLKEH